VADGKSPSLTYAANARRSASISRSQPSSRFESALLRATNTYAVPTLTTSILHVSLIRHKDEL
jgi:hypothetical protein